MPLFLTSQGPYTFNNLSVLNKVEELLTLILNTESFRFHYLPVFKYGAFSTYPKSRDLALIASEINNPNAT